MKSRFLMLVAAIASLVTVAIPVSLAAQEHPTKHRAYHLIDLGTLGGPNSSVNGFVPPMLNNKGVVAGTADTSTPCAYLGGLVSPAFKWEEGTLINLGLLPGGCSSLPNAINSKGMMVGAGDIGVIDPQTGLPEIRTSLPPGYPLKRSR
jgi:uncharacterized membrane protein